MGSNCAMHKSKGGGGGASSQIQIAHQVYAPCTSPRRRRAASEQCTIKVLFGRETNCIAALSGYSTAKLQCSNDLFRAKRFAFNFSTRKRKNALGKESFFSFAFQFVIVIMHCVYYVATVFIYLPATAAAATLSISPNRSRSLSLRK